MPAGSIGVVGGVPEVVFVMPERIIADLKIAAFDSDLRELQQNARSSIDLNWSNGGAGGLKCRKLKSARDRSSGVGHVTVNCPVLSRSGGKH